MAIEIIPDWMANLDDEDVIFIKNFRLSLKAPEIRAFRRI